MQFFQRNNMCESELIGEGTYSKVYAIDQNTAVKISADDCYDYSLREIIIINLFDHPHVIKTKKVEYDGAINKIYMDLYQCDLRTYLDKFSLSLNVIRAFVFDLLSALSHIHSKGIIHCDIKPQNLLIRDPYNPRLVVCDFGLSMFASDEFHSSYIQTCNYRAPEVNISNAKSKHSFAIDMWSVGCVLFEMITGHTLITYRKGVEDTTVYLCEIFGLPDHHRRKDRVRCLSELNIETIMQRLKDKLFAHIDGFLYGQLKSTGLIFFMARCLHPQKGRRPHAQRALYDLFGTAIAVPFSSESLTQIADQSASGAADLFLAGMSHAISFRAKSSMRSIELAKKIYLRYLQAGLSRIHDILLRYACLFVAATLFNGQEKLCSAIENELTTRRLTPVIKAIMAKLDGRIL